MTTGAGRKEPSGSLPRAYRICLKAYPAWYRLAFGDELTTVLEEVHAGEHRISKRECASLVASGLKRRLAATHLDKAGAAYALVLALESAVALMLVATALNLVVALWSTPPYQSGELQGLAFTIGGYEHHVVHLGAYLLVLTMLGVALGVASCRAFKRVGPPEITSAVSRWAAFDIGWLLAQPVVIFTIALAMATRVDAVQPIVGVLSEDQARVSTLLLASGLVVGAGFAAVTWRRFRLMARATRRAVAVALLAAALPWAAFLGAGGQFGASESGATWAPVIFYGPTTPGGNDLATGFTRVQLISTGQTIPFGVACASSAHCLVLGLPAALDARYGAVLSSSKGKWRAAPARGAPDWLNAALAPHDMICPGTHTCYTLSENDSGAVGLDRSTDRGLTWRQLDLPLKLTKPASGDVGFGPQGACMSARACVFVVPQGFAVTADGGSSWETTVTYASLPTPAGLPTTTPVNDYVSGAACPTVRTCLVAVQAVGMSRGLASWDTWLYSTADSGRRWTRRLVAPLSLRGRGTFISLLPGSFACADATHCVFVAPPEDSRLAQVAATADGGATFITSPAPDWGSIDVGLSCGARLVCWALPEYEGARNLWRSANGGLTWSETSSLPGGTAFGMTPFRGRPGSSIDASLACPGPRRCVALAFREGPGVDEPNVLVSTIDSGRTWTVAKIPPLPPRYRPRPPPFD